MNLGPIQDKELDQKDEREIREQEGLLKKKLKKKENPIRKIIMRAVKAAVIPMLLMLAKILAVTLLIAAIVSLFTITIGEGDGNSETTSTDEEYSSSSSTGSIELDTTANYYNVENTEQIQDFINNYVISNQESVDSALKAKMLEKVNEIYKWQEDYGYSALLLITIAIEDGETAENFETFLNTMNQKAATWKNNGYKTTKEIAKDYVGDDTAQEWANNIESQMQLNAGNAGIITYGQEITATGDGYDNAFQAKDGKIYRNYKQIKGSYIYEKWCGDWEIYWTGCALISVTTVVSGYQNTDVSPMEVVKDCAPEGQGLYIFDALSKYGITGTRPYQDRDAGLTLAQKQELKRYLNNGGVAIIRVQKSLNSTFTDSEHWMVLLDYNSTTNEVYLSNPSATTSEKTGWLDAEKVLAGCTEFIEISN